MAGIYGRPILVDSARSQLAGWITSRRPNQSTAHRLSGYIGPSRMLQRFTARRIKTDEKKLFPRVRALRSQGCLRNA